MTIKDLIIIANIVIIIVIIGNVSLCYAEKA